MAQELLCPCCAHHAHVACVRAGRPTPERRVVWRGMELSQRDAHEAGGERRQEEMGL